jgi:hypothetical protein
MVSSCVQPERCKTLREYKLDALSPSRTSLTKLLQPSKLKKASFSRSPMDGWTYDRFMHPVKSSRSSLRLPAKFGDSTRYLELVRSTLFKKGRYCENQTSIQLLAKYHQLTLERFLYFSKLD